MKSFRTSLLKKINLPRIKKFTLFLIIYIVFNQLSITLSNAAIVEYGGKIYSPGEVVTLDSPGRYPYIVPQNKPNTTAGSCIWDSQKSNYGSFCGSPTTCFKYIDIGNGSRSIGGFSDNNTYDVFYIGSEFFTWNGCKCAPDLHAPYPYWTYEYFSYMQCDDDPPSDDPSRSYVHIYDSATVPVKRKCPTIESAKLTQTVNPLVGEVADVSGSAYKYFNIGSFSWQIEYGSNIKTGDLTASPGNGVSLNYTWDMKKPDGTPYEDGIYPVKYTIKSSASGCSDYTVQSQVTVKSSCGFEITSLTGTSSTLDPSSGGSVGIKGTVNVTTGHSISWHLNILNQVFYGTGNSITQTWNGKYADGTVVKPGTYSATLTVSTSDGKCTNNKTVYFTVKEAPVGQCGLFVNFGSSAHMASGNLSHTQELFSSRGGTLPASISIFYNSLDPAIGALGHGWSHEFDYSLKQNSDGSVLISEPNWKYKYYTLQNGAYVGKPGNYSTLTKKPDDTFTLTSKDGQLSTFSGSGKLASISDRNGNTFSLAYSGNNLASVTDPSDRTVNFAYDASNHMTSITDPTGNAFSFTVAGNTLSSVTQPDGGDWKYTYDANAYMLTKTDPMGNVTSYGYDNQHRVIFSSDPEGRTRNIAYPQTTDTVKSTTLTEKDGGQWSYSYDTQKGYLLSKTDPQSGTTSYSYDVNGNRTATTSPDGSNTSATYDNVGNMLTSTNALKQTSSYTYNTFGQVTGITDAQGAVTTYIYDAKGNMTALTDPAGGTTKYDYDSKGNIAKVTDSADQVTSFGYDQKGNLATVTDSSGATSSYTYDNAGNVTSVTDAKGAVTQFVYDVKSRLVKSNDPNGNATTYTYDANGNKLSDTDANGNITKYEYNSHNQLIKIIDALKNSTTYAYGGSACPSCGGGNGEKLTSLTDAKGNTTSYQYDQLGRMVKETDPLGSITTYTYDTKGNLASKNDAKGATVSYSYDPAGRLTGRSYPDGTQESLLYDAGDNLITWQTPNESITYNYDTAKRPLEKNYATLGKGIRYEYDTSGRKNALIDPEGGRTVYTYDAVGRVAKITDPAGNWASYSYDSIGRRNSVAYSNGTSTAYNFDTSGRLLGMTTTGPSGTISSYQYSYDKVGNRLSMKETGGNSTTYSYDKLYRLTAYDETRPDASKGTFTYDTVGNRINMLLAKKYLSGDSRSFTYSIGQGNQLLGIMEKGRHSPIETSFTYDKNGSLVSRAVTQGKTTSTTGYQYDYLNRLSTVATPEGKTVVIGNLADGFNRLSKTTGTETTKYFHDGMSVLGEYDTTGNRIARYTLGTGTDEIIAKKDATGIYFYHYDGLGSITAVTDGTGKVVAKYDYEPFGRMKETSTSTVNNAHAFTGREWDRETGLYYYRARYYDPMEGRFIQKDPIGFNGRDVNLFGYVQNNPVNRTDPSGLIWPFTGSIHGKWCGGNWTGEREEEYSPNHDVPGYFSGPLDPLDRACEVHDKCYYNCRNSYPCDKKSRGQCFLVCDTALDDAALTAGGLDGNLVSAAMRRLGNRIEPNPCSCGGILGE